MKNLIRVYRGDIALATAIEDGRLTVDGKPKLSRRLGRWFNFDTMAKTPLAEGGPARRLISMSSEPQ
ncbi:hypothetical protein RBY4I_3249 [Rhodobacterales bacterium Y4I]|nr:hypothetical protein RBY4I_3249 [Rhodobacterales bacterium Y4I]